MNKLLIGLGAVALIIVSCVFGYELNQKKPQSLGSVNQANEYHSVMFDATTTDAYLIKSGNGTLGTVIVNSASAMAAGGIDFYDASTTNANLRTISATTSLRKVAAISDYQSVGDYTYDVLFYDGLIAVFRGTQVTSTVTFR